MKKKRMEFLFPVPDHPELVVASLVCCDNIMLNLEANAPFSRGKVYCSSCSTVFITIATTEEE